jgi:filamentous hemagglutinin family protein
MSALPRERMAGFSLRMKPLVLAVAAALSPSTEVLALPTGEQVVAGQVGVSRPTAQSMVVQQGTPKAIVNWQGFSIGGNEAVDFRQPAASSVILNRVVGNNASEIYGRLSANGQVFLVNPSGVLFGRTAMVDVGALVASTLSLSNEDFLAGRYRFGASGAPAAVENQGALAARDNGFIALLGGQVSNSGTISARLGTAGLAAGGKVTLDFAGDGLVRITVDEAALAAEVRNSGAVIADGGQAILSTRSAEALTQAVVNQTGVVRARTLTERQGKIVLDGGSMGQTLASGTLDASGRGPGEKGGEIQVLGHHVGVTGQALLDASGDAGGGAVLVGGDFQGKNPAIRNASATWFGPEATIRADALTKGDGGKVIVWSDDATRAHGTITARGGAVGGDGGLVETSGRYLETAGIRVNASAPRGAAGEWLLDPINVTIQDGAEGASTNVSPSPNFTANATSAVVTDADIEAALNGGTSVTVRTGDDLDTPQDGDIIVLNGTTIVKNTPGDVTLRLNAHNHIVIQRGVEIRASSGRLNVALISDLDAAGGGGIYFLSTPSTASATTIATSGGDVRLFGRCDTAVSSCDTPSGRATGNLFSTSGLSGGVALSGTEINTIPSAGGAGGNVTVLGQGEQLDLKLGRGGHGVSLAGGVKIETGSGTVTLDGVGGVGVNAGAAVMVGEGGAGVLLDGTTLLNTTSGAIVINGTGGAGGAALGSGQTGGNGGVGFSMSNSSLQTGSGNITVTGTGGVGGAGFNNAEGNGTDAGAGGVGVLLSGAIAPTIQTSSGLIQISSFGGNGGAGGSGTGPGGDGGDGGAGFSGGGATIQTGSANADIAGTGGSGGSGGTANSCGALNFDCAGGGNGGDGIQLAGLIEAAGGGVRIGGTGGIGGKGGDALASTGPFASSGGFGGHGIVSAPANPASIIGTSGSISLSGTAGDGGPAALAGSVPRAGTEGFSGSGIFLQGIAGIRTIATTSGDISIFGVATSALANRSATGLVLSHTTVETTAGGSIDIRGRGDAAESSSGASIQETTIRTQGSPGTIVISGEATSADFGVELQAEDNRNFIGGPATSGNITIRAANGGGGDSINLQSFEQPDTVIQTTGVVNLRPGGVSATGVLTAANAEPIEIDNPPPVITSNFTFRLSPAELNSIQDGTAGIVIGSDTHTGRISVLTPTTFNDNVTLQNEGAGSLGIVVAGSLSNPGNSITLSSRGPVAINGVPIDAGTGNVAIRGGGASGVAASPGVSMASGSRISAGNISIDGIGTAGNGTTPDGGRGVQLNGASLQTASGSISVRGVGGPGGTGYGGDGGRGGAGVELNNSSLQTASGSMSITGIGGAGGAAAYGGPGGPGGDGVDLFASSAQTTAGGSIDIRGRAGAADAFSRGVVTFDSTIRTQGAPGAILISGESPGSGFGVDLPNSHSDFDGPGSNSIEAASILGNIVIRATNGGNGDSINIESNTDIGTPGVVNLRPGGVSASGELAAANAAPIEIAEASPSPPTPFTFRLSPAELNTIQDGTATIVIGSNTHTGPIRVLTPVTFRDNVTLQNAGPGSQGIALGEPLNYPGGLITLSSAGPVTQAEAAPITASSLLLHGTGADSNFVLTNPANAVAQFAASTPVGGQVRFENTGPLTIGPITGTGFDSAGNAPTPISAPNTVSFGDLFVRTTGNLTLNHSISTVGSDIDLVTGGVFNNAGGGVLSPGGTGSWQVWASTWTGEQRGGLVPTSPFPNFYGCIYPGTCASDITVPTGGNRFIYQERPTLTVSADNQSRLLGQANPPFTSTVSGLVNNDTPSDAVVANLSSPATQLSPAGTYPINVTDAFSPVGYIVQTVNGSLNIPGLVPLNDLTDSSRLLANDESLVYASNLGTPFMCTPTGAFAVPASAEEASDNLSREWSRVRVRPNLTNCLGLGQRGGCDDF